MESCQRERTFVRLALLALVIFFVSVRVPKHPEPALQLEGDAMQLASWESPTGFLLQAAFPITQPN